MINRRSPRSRDLVVIERIEHVVRTLDNESTLHVLNLLETDVAADDPQGDEIVLRFRFLVDDFDDLAGLLIEGLSREHQVAVAQLDDLAQQSLGAIAIDIVPEDLSTELVLDDDRFPTRLLGFCRLSSGGARGSQAA